MPDDRAPLTGPSTLPMTPNDAAGSGPTVIPEPGVQRRPGAVTTAVPPSRAPQPVAPQPAPVPQRRGLLPDLLPGVDLPVVGL